MSKPRRPMFYDPKKRKPLESDIEAAIGLYAKKKGCLYWKFTSPANASVPDRVIVTPRGVVAFLELKRPPNKPTPAQAEKMQKLQERGAHVAWTDNVVEGKKLIDQWCSLPGPHDDTDPLSEIW